MNAKERFYSGLAKETIGKITSNTDNWTSFLRTMSRNYEFTYPETGDDLCSAPQCDLLQAL